MKTTLKSLELGTPINGNGQCSCKPLKNVIIDDGIDNNGNDIIMEMPMSEYEFEKPLFAPIVLSCVLDKANELVVQANVLIEIDTNIEVDDTVDFDNCGFTITSDMTRTPPEFYIGYNKKTLEDGSGFFKVYQVNFTVKNFELKDPTILTFLRLLDPETSRGTETTVQETTEFERD